MAKGGRRLSTRRLAPPCSAAGRHGSADATQGPPGDQGREPAPFLGPPRGRRRARQSRPRGSSASGRRARPRPRSTSRPAIPVTFADVADLGRLVPRDAPHQGIVAEVERLDDILLADLLDRAEDGRPLLVLDQVTDPHNVGAILRSAAAFDALGVVTQDRHAPPESGALAKAASGALETMPWVRVVNLARALDEIAEAGFWRIGLAGEAETTLAEALGPARVALVLGAEGEGMRQNTEAHCDALARLPIGGVESLNVSNAAAVALYAASVS